MSWPYSLVKVVATGDILLAADYNNEHTNHINNNIPTSIDDASATTPDMQHQTNPLPSGLSPATNLAEEIYRLRYMIAGNAGVTYWYTLPGMTNNQLYSHTHTGTAVTDCPKLDGTASILPATITAASITDGTITGAKLASNAALISIGTGGITNTYIANSTIAEAKLDATAQAKIDAQLRSNSPVTTGPTSTSSLNYTYNTHPGAVSGILVTTGSTSTVSVSVDGGAAVTSGTFTGTQWVDSAGGLSTTFVPCNTVWTTSLSITVTSGGTSSKSIVAYFFTYS